MKGCEHTNIVIMAGGIGRIIRMLLLFECGFFGSAYDVLAVTVALFALSAIAARAVAVARGA